MVDVRGVAPQALVRIEPDRACDPGRARADLVVADVVDQRAKDEP